MKMVILFFILSIFVAACGVEGDPSTSGTTAKKLSQRKSSTIVENSIEGMFQTSAVDGVSEYKIAFDKKTFSISRHCGKSPSETTVSDSSPYTKIGQEIHLAHDIQKKGSYRQNEVLKFCILEVPAKFNFVLSGKKLTTTAPGTHFQKVGN